MTNTTLDGSSSPFLIPATTIEQANDGDALYLLGSIDNHGTIFINGSGTISGTPTPADFALLFLASPTVTLGGGGTLLLAGEFSAEVGGNNATPQTLVNNDNTITGAGNIGQFSAGSLDASTTLEPIVLVNGLSGVIDANGTVPAAPPFGMPTTGLFIETGNLTMINDGLLEATGVGGLYVESNVDQTGGGTLLATGAGVVAQTGTVAGGTVQISAGGTIVLSGLDGSTAPVTITPGTTLVPTTLLGSIVNHGTLLANIDNGSGLIGGEIALNSPTVTLSGGGSVQLFGDVYGYVHLSGTDAAVHTLVNVDNTISGYGFIGYPAFDTTAATPVAITNEALGVIDASGTSGSELELGLYGGGTVLQNTGLLEATANGLLSITDATLDNAGGTVMLSGTVAAASLTSVSLNGGLLSVSGTGDTISLQTADLSGAAIDTSGGGAIEFTAGANTITTGTAVLSLSAAENLGLTGGSLAITEGTVDNTGSFVDDGTLLVAAPIVTLDGGGTVQLGGSIAAAGTATLINVDNTITGAGEISDGALVLTNDTAGVIDGAGLDFAAPARNAGVLENVTVGANLTTTIDNAGGTLLANGGTVTLLDADIAGGTLAATDGGTFSFGSADTIKSNVTLDGRANGVTLAAGTTLQAYIVTISLPNFYDVPTNITMLGTVDLNGSIQSPYSGSGTPGTVSNAGLLFGSSGVVAGDITNDGTLLAQGGLLKVTGNVGGSGGIAIASGGTFELGSFSSQPVDFRGQPNGKLMLDTPDFVGVSGAVPEFSGILDNLADGDAIDLVGAQIKTAEVVGGNTLAVTLTDASTLDYALANLRAGATFDVVSASSATNEVYNFNYSGTGDTQGIGSFTLEVGSGGTVSLAEVTGFNMTLNPGAVFTTNYSLSDLTAFAATVDSNGTITTLSLATDDGVVDDEGIIFPSHTEFEVASLGANGATTDADASDGGAVQSQGSITVTPNGALLSELVVACFAEGTRIRTPVGDRRVETLRGGDTVATAAGGLRRVVWVGHRCIDCRRHPRPQEVQPVRVRAHAFGQNAPHADLWLSPDHAVFVDGVLIPVRYLANGATVAREDVAHVTYWHVELDAHDAVLAENLACESYLDTGNRGAFVECEDALMMHADFARAVWDARAFAPLALAGSAVEAVRRHLLRGAEALGHRLTAEPDFHLLVGGQELWPEPDGYRFVLPAGARELRLMSRAGVPAETLIAGTDHRRLGVAVAALRADGRAVGLDDARLGAGWHAPEAGWRWTDGAATLALPGMRTLDVAVAITARYWDAERTIARQRAVASIARND